MTEANNEIQKRFWDNNFKEEGKPDDSDFSRDIKYFKERFLNMVISPEVKNVLEIGCGNGMLTFFLLKRKIKITAVDISEKAIVNLNRWFPGEIESEKLKLVCGDLLEFLANSKENFDVIIGAGIIHHIERKNRKKLFRLVYRRLNPGGIFACGPEPNAGGLYSLAWRLAGIFFRMFGMKYDWEVEKETLNMKPDTIEEELRKAGFEKSGITPFQCIPHFHLSILEFVDRKIINHVRGKFSMYIIVKGEKNV